MTTSKATPWLSNPRPNINADLRLFCFPYAGGSASIYQAWVNRPPGAVEVNPVQLPGREMRMGEAPHVTLATLVPALADALTPYFDKPFAFFGHSMGAIIGFELARHLRRAGHAQPVHLFVSGRRAPQLPSAEPATHDLPDAEFMEELRSLKGTPPAALDHPELMQLMLPILRADFSICQTYACAPEPPMSCPISAFGGLEDEGVSREMVAAWGEQTTGAFNLRMLPGDHFFLNSAPSLLLQLVLQELRQHRASTSLTR